MMLDTSLFNRYLILSDQKGVKVLTAAQLRAARALLGIEQKALAEMAGVSLPTIQRMEASEGIVRGNIDTLTKVVAALDRAGVELLHIGGRGVRLKECSRDD